MTLLHVNFALNFRGCMLYYIGLYNEGTFFFSYR
jgi:hypothetical protein